MKITLFITLSLMLILHSCGQKKDTFSEISSYKNKVVLAAFNDMVTASSFNPDALVSLPLVVNFSDKMTAVKYQGDRGTCTFFATAALVEAAIKLDLGIDVNLSEEFMIYSTKSQGHYKNVEASHVSVNLQAVKSGGILLEKDWSYYPSFFGAGKPCDGIDGEHTDAPMRCYMHSPPASILEKVIPASAIKTGFMRKNTNEIIKYLANNQRPLTISLPVNYKGWKDWGEVTYTEQMRQQCLVDSSACGAHSVILTGYNLNDQVFYFKNSWGNDWGQAGFGTLSFAMVDRYVDGYLYFAKVDGTLNIPEDANVDNFKIESLIIKSALSDTDIDLEVKIKASQIEGRYVEIIHNLGYTEEVSPGIQSKVLPLYYQQGNIQTIAQFENLDLSGQREIGLSMPENILNNNYVQEVLADPLSYQLVLESVVYLHSDTSATPTPVFNVQQRLEK